jgi:hypothetical protein
MGHPPLDAFVTSSEDASGKISIGSLDDEKFHG